MGLFDHSKFDRPSNEHIKLDFCIIATHIELFKRLGNRFLKLGGVSVPLYHAAFAMAVLSVLAGCSSSPYGALSVVPVSGKVVMEDGTVLSGGVVTFLADDPKVVSAPVGMIGPNGIYSLRYGDRTGAPTGRYRVMVLSQAPMMDPKAIAKAGVAIAAKYQSADKTDLNIEIISSPGAGHYDLKLSPASPASPTP